MLDTHFPKKLVLRSDVPDACPFDKLNLPKRSLLRKKGKTKMSAQVLSPLKSKQINLQIAYLNKTRKPGEL